MVNQIPFSLISKSLNGSSKPYSLSAQSEQLERQNASLGVSVPINQSARKRLPFREMKSLPPRGLLKVLVFSGRKKNLQSADCYHLTQSSANFYRLFCNICRLFCSICEHFCNICRLFCSSLQDADFITYKT